MVINYNKQQQKVRLIIATFGFFAVMALTIFFGYMAYTHFITPNTEPLSAWVIFAVICGILFIIDMWLGSIFYDQVLEYLDE
jgi:hypothetical protein